MSLLISFIVAALVGLVVWGVMSVVPPLKRFAEIGGVVAFALVLLERLGAF